MTQPQKGDLVVFDCIHGRLRGVVNEATDKIVTITQLLHNYRHDTYCAEGSEYILEMQKIVDVIGKLRKHKGFLWPWWEIDRQPEPKPLDRRLNV